MKKTEITKNNQWFLLKNIAQEINNNRIISFINKSQFNEVLYLLFKIFVFDIKINNYRY